MFRVQMDTKAAERQLTNTQKQLVFAWSLALNRTQEERQKVLGTHIVSTLTVRSASTRRELPKVVRFAREDRADRKAGKLQASLRIIGGNVRATAPIFQRLGAIVLRQDEGGAQTSSALYRSQRGQFVVGGFIIPAPGLRTSTKPMSRALYPDAIGLSTRSTRIEDSDDPARQYKGGKKKRGRGFKKGTRYYFVAEGVGIFVRQQVGKQSEYDAVWFFRTRITLPPRLQLEATYLRDLEPQLAANFRGFFAFAMRTAK